MVANLGIGLLLVSFLYVSRDPNVYK